MLLPFSAKTISVQFGKSGTIATFPIDDDIAKREILGMSVTAHEGVDGAGRRIVTEEEARSMFVTLISGKRRIEIPLTFFISKKRNEYVEVNLKGYSTGDSKIETTKPVAEGSVILFTFFYNGS